jgi:hypothetical protein
VSKPAVSLPSISLNLIVRDEAPIVREVLVDTGSPDGSQDLIRDPDENRQRMAANDFCSRGAFEAPARYLVATPQPSRHISP